MEPKDVTQPEFVLANKIKFAREEALELAQKASKVVVAKGKKVLHFDTKDADTEALGKAICGPSGTLRAPAMRVGDTFLVGFHAEAYASIFD